MTGADLRHRLLGLRAWLHQSRGHGLWILSWTVVGLAGTAAAPLLLDRPVLLMVMSPRTLFVALAVPHLDLVSFVVLGTARLCVSDASYFILGTRVPRSDSLASGSLARGTQRLVRMMCASRALTGLVLFLRPSGRYLAVAGAHRVSAPLATVTSVAGTVLYLTAVHQGLGLMFT